MFKSIKNKACNASIAVIGAAATSPAFANNTQAINDAVSAATLDVGTVTAGVISVAALGFGLGMIVSWLRK